MEVETSVIVRNSEALSNIKREQEDSDRKIWEAYAEQIRKTEGYEVMISPPKAIMRGFLPMGISLENRYEDYDMCAQLAVNKFNSYFKDLADEAKVKTYQTQVLMGLPPGTWIVKSMRLKPSLDEHGCYRQAESFWKEK